MTQMDLSHTSNTDYTNTVDDVEIEYKNTDGATSPKETSWTNPNWSKYYGLFKEVPDLQSALIMKSVWNVGKGYETDTKTKVILDHISGWGKDTFDDILFNLDLVSNICGDAYAEIIRDKETDTLLNLKMLDSGSMATIVDEYGVILRYEQTSKSPNKAVKTWKPNEILHICKNRVADNIHGLGNIEALEKTILADNEVFTDLKSVMHHQAKPFIMFKLKTDDEATITQFITKVNSIRNLSEDLIIPDDENIVSWEVVQVNISQTILEYQNQLRNKFYRALGLPLILFGNAGSTESGGKMEMFAHETKFEREQRFLEMQLWNQLGIKINLIPPQTLLNNLQNDASKDGAAQQMNLQQSDLMAGAGR